MTKNGWWVSVPGSKGQGLEQAPPSACIYLDLLPGWQLANEIAKPKVSINSNNSSIDS